MNCVFSRLKDMLNACAGQRRNETDITAGELIDRCLEGGPVRLKTKKQQGETFRKALPRKKVMRWYQIGNRMDVLLFAGPAKKIPRRLRRGGATALSALPARAGL